MKKYFTDMSIFSLKEKLDIVRENKAPKCEKVHITNLLSNR